MIHLHKWKHVRRHRTSLFCGDYYKTYDNEFRICTKCGKAQRVVNDILGKWGEWGWTLSTIESNILLKSLIDKGSYYEIKEEKLWIKEDI